MTYLSGFQIVHRYAYVVVPAAEEPYIVFPRKRDTSGSRDGGIEQVFADRPGEHIRRACTRCEFKRVGVYGLD